MEAVSSPSLKSVAFGAVKGASAFGYVLAATLFCAACSGLPIVAGLLGGLGVGARFGVSAGVVSATVLTYSLVRASRSRRAQACAAPRSGVERKPSELAGARSRRSLRRLRPL